MKKRRSRSVSWFLRVLMAWILALSLCVPTVQSVTSAESTADPSESTTEVTETQTSSETNDETQTSSDSGSNEETQTTESSDETQATSGSNEETQATEDPSADSSESTSKQATSDSAATADSKTTQTTVLTTSDQITLKASYVSEDGKVSDTGTFILLFKDKDKQSLSNNAEKVDGYTLSDITLEDGTAVTDVVRKKDKNDKTYYEAVDDSGTVRAQLTENETIVFHYQASAKPKRSAAKLNQTTSISVNKVFLSSSSRTSVRRAKKSMNAENVTMQLFYIDTSGNEKPISQLQSTKNSRLRKAAKKADTSAVTLQEVMNNGGIYQWDNLPKYDADGNEIQYTVREVGAEKIGYQPTYQKAIINGVQGYRLKNVSTKEISVQKVWYGTPADSVTIDLYQNGEYTGSSVTLSPDNGWIADFGSWPGNDNDGKKITYSVKERNSDQYIVKIDEGNGYNFTVTNYEKININVNKVWENGASGDSVTVDLLRNGTKINSLTLTADNGWTDSFTDLVKYDSYGIEYEYTVEERNTGYESTVTGSAEEGFTITNKAVEVKVNKQWADGASGDSVTVDLLRNGEKTGDQVTLNEDNNWEASFEGLKKYDETGNEYKYTVEEKNTGYESTVTGSAEEGFTITNTGLTISVNKIWTDGASGDSVTVDLLRNGEKTGDQLTLNADNDWTASFKGLKKYDENGDEYEYTVAEENEEYDSEITGSVEDGFTITNAPSTKQVTIPVVKKWKGGKSRAAVTVKLLSSTDGKEWADTGKTITLDGKTDETETRAWKASFKANKYSEDGKEMKYKVTEENGDEYNASYDGNMNDGFTITNTSPADPEQKTDTKKTNKPKAKKKKAAVPKTGVAMPILADLVLMMAAVLAVIMIRRKRISK
ncbi:Cna B-type domain-containing protein [Catenisphaera adipataccumulans]|uniref:CNA-B domain-containing protein n=1 Tax=Catenisphaera adipataccumulans TaxID=700500 RepID=A0A7W8CX88_9FIRM|nr:Cna B-type domain-containing protein [Catenisphaera adipataccumulans]MBB5182089.1 hypothetical protein [Catenisphaera adipataccumulans]